jgi:anionic cell wall polymer biosynthesis LytR-Cps2A-Psr (LCP) family protein
VGGVTVEVKDDFSHVDPTITMGMVTLDGQQAVNYVRTRKDVGDQLNLSRIDRQKEYINSFAAAFRAAYDADGNMVQDLYGEISPYLVTDLSVTVLNGMVEHYGDYTIHRVMTPEGDNVMGEQYFEFYAHEDKLRDLSLELFYAPKE